MKPWRKRLGRSLSPKPLLGGLFAKIEDSSRIGARLLRYHSRTRLLAEEDCFSTIHRPVRVLEDRYIRHYEIVRNLEPFSLASTSQADQVPIHSAILENMVIHGHIKVPIDAVTGEATSFYFPRNRLDWGDVYPLPVRRTDHIDGDVIFVPRLTNIFHLLVEHVVPAIAAAIRYQSQIQKKLTIVSQVDFPVLRLFTDFLTNLGYDAQLRLIGPLDQIAVDRLLMSRATAQDADFNYAYAEEMKIMGAFLDQKIKDVSVPDFVYIERSQTPRRKILNQGELIAQLKSNRIQNIRFSFDNFLTQIAVFRKSKLIISAHGAALTNLAFAKPEQALIEIFSEDLRPKCYINMASQHDVNYYALIGSKQSGNENFSIPIERVLSLVQSLTD